MQHADLTPTLAATLGKIAAAATTARIVVDSGTSVYHAQDGTDTIIGGPTGAVTPFVGDTTPPPIPSPPVVTSQSGTLFVTWDGTFVGGAEQPPDFAYVTVYIDGAARDHLAKPGTISIGDLTAAASVKVALTASDDAHDTDGNSAPNESAASEGVPVTIAAAVDAADVAAMQDDIAGASRRADEAVSTAIQASLDASSAVVLRVDSTRGLVFKNSLISTVLSVTVFAKGQTITDIVTLQDAFGAGAYLEWRWKRLDDSDFGVISSEDTRIGAGGFTLTVSPADVDTKTVFMCVLNT